jgi:predicted dehydrogenase
MTHHTSASPIRVAVFGLGYIGLRHAQVLQAHPAYELAGWADPRQEALAAKSEVVALGCSGYQSPESLLAAHPGLDLVHVCTPNGLHAAHASLALRAGADVLCEKPLAITTAECEALALRVQATQRRVYCVVQNRLNPQAAWLHDLVQRGTLGRILQVNISCLWNRTDRYYDESPWRGTLALDAGPLFTQFSHFVDLLCWTFGAPEVLHADFACQTHARSTEFEDTGLVSFRLPGGALGSLSYSTCVWGANLESRITVVGERGSVQLGGQYMNDILHCHGQGLERPELPPAAPPNDYGYYQGSAAGHAQLVEAMAQHLRGTGPALPLLAEGQSVVAFIETVYARRPAAVLRPGAKAARLQALGLEG